MSEPVSDQYVAGYLDGLDRAEEAVGIFRDLSDEPTAQLVLGVVLDRLRELAAEGPDGGSGRTG